MTLFYIINELMTITKPMVTAYTAKEKFKESEDYLIGILGGLKNPLLSRFFTRTITGTVSRTGNTITIPDGAGRVLKVLVSGKAYNVVPPQGRNSHGYSILNQRTAVVDGNRIEFFGLASEQFGNETSVENVEIVVEVPNISTVYVDGLLAFETRIVHREGTKPQPSFAIENVSHQLFDDDSLFGGTLRVVKSASYCSDYTISGNSYIGRNIVFVKTPPSQAPVSWIQFAEAVATPITDAEKKEHPGLSSLTSSGNTVFPAAVSRLMLPESLRPIALIHAKWKITNNAAYHAEFQQALENWRVENAS